MHRYAGGTRNVTFTLKDDEGSEDEVKISKANITYIGGAMKTPNEVRGELGLPLSNSARGGPTHVGHPTRPGLPRGHPGRPARPTRSHPGSPWRTRCPSTQSRRFWRPARRRPTKRRGPRNTTRRSAPSTRGSSRFEPRRDGPGCAKGGRGQGVQGVHLQVARSRVRVLPPHER